MVRERIIKISKYGCREFIRNYERINGTLSKSETESVSLIRCLILEKEDQLLYARLSNLTLHQQKLEIRLSEGRPIVDVS